jgi:hypothetical protein
MVVVLQSDIHLEFSICGVVCVVPRSFQGLDFSRILMGERCAASVGRGQFCAKKTAAIKRLLFGLKFELQPNPKLGSPPVSLMNRFFQHAIG